MPSGGPIFQITDLVLQLLVGAAIVTAGGFVYCRWRMGWPIIPKKR